MNDNPNARTGFTQIVDAMLLARAQRGDMQAFAALYDIFGSACFNLALRLLGRHAQAEDLVQEVFLKVIDTIKSYRGDAPFGAWLKRLVVNACIDELRGQRRGGLSDADEMLAAMPAPTSDPGGRVDALSLLQQLPARARTVLVLHEIEGYTHAELSKLFGQSESYSKSILARALKRLGEFVNAPVVEATCQNKN